MHRDASSLGRSSEAASASRRPERLAGLLVAVAVLALATGCSSASRSTLHLEGSGLETFGRVLGGLDRCVRAGMMTPEVAALGETSQRSQLTRYSYDSLELASYREKWAKPDGADWSWCDAQVTAITRAREREEDLRPRPEPRPSLDQGLRFPAPIRIE